jgi:hypothetical protein
MGAMRKGVVLAAGAVVALLLAGAEHATLRASADITHVGVLRVSQQPYRPLGIRVVVNALGPVPLAGMSRA